MLWRISVTTFSLLEYNDINKCQQSTKPNETVASAQHETARQWAYATCNEERTDVDGRRVEDCMDDTETMIAKSWCSIRSGRRNGISKINIKSNESTRQSQFRRHVYHSTKLTLTPPESQELWFTDAIEKEAMWDGENWGYLDEWQKFTFLKRNNTNDTIPMCGKTRLQLQTTIDLTTKPLLITSITTPTNTNRQNRRCEVEETQRSLGRCRQQ